MECPECQFENPDGSIFCGSCGSSIEIKITCDKCGTENPKNFNFCNKCGHDLRESQEFSQTIESKVINSSDKKEHSPFKKIIGERKHVTVLFSDMSGYTSMSEKLDPEEVKKITIKIFAEAAKIVSKYEGFIEKYIGDAVVAIFGATKSFEDDPIRAIKSAIEIRDFANGISSEYEEKIGQPISMHSGINTGLVVTGEVDLEKGTHGITGDTINLAARLSSLGKENDILVGQDTYIQSKGFFNFDALESTKVKGKAKPVLVYKVLSIKERPQKVYRFQGVRAELIGRKVEMNQLAKAVQRLAHEKRGSVITVCGSAGTGKSRLIEEFRYSLNLPEIQWLEGHAYPYTQNVPYYPLINLLNKTFQIEENDPPEKIKEKVQNGLHSLMGKETNFIPYIGSLFSINYPEIKEVSREYWKLKLFQAVQKTITSLSLRAPTIICFEDLHWTDPSFLELIYVICSELKYPILFLFTYRPVISLFTSLQIRDIEAIYHEIQIKDLSSSESQIMVESLLKTSKIPPALELFIQDKIAGNPFYIEEVINSLIESKVLIKDEDNWKILRSVRESDISATIHGVISGRIDRLEKPTKRILQEASVIGKDFFYEILNGITEFKESLDTSLIELERLDFINKRATQLELEYTFKHALTREIIYNGLLNKERREIHERIGIIFEQLFKNRLPEFYETLALHFRKGKSDIKAVDYLMKAGEKYFHQYALAESHQCYKKAYELLINKQGKSDKEKRILFDLLNQWSFVFHYRADYKEMVTLLSSHAEFAERSDEKAKFGMFYAWLGLAMFCAGKLKDSYQHLSKALTISVDTEELNVKGYASSFLSFACSDLGLLDEAIVHGIRAKKLIEYIKEDEFFFFTNAALGRTYAFRGEWKKSLEAGKKLLNYKREHFSSQRIATGYWIIGYTHLLRGNPTKAIEIGKKGLQSSVDLFTAQMLKISIGGWCTLAGRYKEAEEYLKDAISFSKKSGLIQMNSNAKMFFGIVIMAKGNLNKGLRMIKDAQKVLLENDNNAFYMISEFLLGKIYFKITQESKAIKPISILKNLGFIIREVPFAAEKAKQHYLKAIDIGSRIGAKYYTGMAYFDLGHLYKNKGKREKAQECILEAIKIFQGLEIEVSLNNAKEFLQDIEH